MMASKFTLSPAGTALGLALSLVLAGCGGIATNQSLYSVHEPVVERSHYAIDLINTRSGLPDSEARRLAAWFADIDLRYGDHVGIANPDASESERAAVAAMLARYGLVIEDGPRSGASEIAYGMLRVVVTRSTASVPGCPDWSAKSDFNPRNATSSNYGCAVNSNVAAMVADSEHLLHGDDSGDDRGGHSARKAIETYRDAVPTGAAGLKVTTSKEQ